MAEQSSTVATLRALVMLLCVILIPVAAICGTSFPNVVKAIQNGRLPTTADFRAAAGPDGQANARSEAPAFRDPTMPTVNKASASRPGGYAPAYTPPGSPAASPVVQIGYNAPVAGDAPPTSFPQDAASRYAEKSLGSEPQRLPSPDQAAKFSIPTTPAAATGGGLSAAPDSQFKRVQDRLRQLGATYYLLEAWGDQQQQYRFYCRMAKGGDAHVVQPFQCIDRDPLQAMAKVLEDVEAWQKHGS